MSVYNKINPKVRNWILLSGIFTFLGLINFLTVRADFAAEAKAIPFWKPLTWEMTSAFATLLILPFVFRFVKKFRFERKTWHRTLLIHLSAVPFFSMTHVFIMVSMRHPVYWVLGESYQYAVFLSYRLLMEFLKDFMTYWAGVGIIYGIEFFKKYQANKLKTSQLETQLARAQLQALKMQLHPHFLFNTLNSISSLIYKDIEAADTMIERLSDLLRLTLDNTGSQEITLKEELEILNIYLEIQQIRFQDHLTVKMDIEPETMDALVPNLILQPLVENAIRHGISDLQTNGYIEIHTHKKNGILQIQIRDNGKGISEELETVLQKGIGLANTQDRLGQLYGNTYQLNLQNMTDNGFSVNLEIPFRLNSKHKL